MSGNASQIRQGIKHSASIGLTGPYYPPGPLPPHDHCGYEVALQMVLSSLEKGSYSTTHKQWDTIRKLRSAYSNQVRAAAISNFSSLSMADNKGAYSRLAPDPCGSLWFQRFMEGCKRRMGQDSRPNRALSSDLMRELLSCVEGKAVNATTIGERHTWVMAGAYFCFSYVLSLRGSEGLLTDLEGMEEHFEGRENYVVVPLLGKFKGEHHTKQHLMSSVNVTDSGIRVRLWGTRLLAIHRSQGRTRGPAFINNKGMQSSSKEFNQLFIGCLTEIFEDNHVLFAIDIKRAEDVSEKYHVFRSFRRGSESRAVAMNVSSSDRYAVNRWRQKEQAGAGRVNHTIDQHYTDVVLAPDSFLRYTKAM